MRRSTILATVLAWSAAAAAPAAGGEPAAAELAARSIAARAPAGWQVRVRWRERALVAFMAPPTIQEAFDLFYDARRQAETVATLCPPVDDPVWRHLDAAQDVAIEPVVMGKSGLRVSCRLTLREAGAATPGS